MDWQVDGADRETGEDKAFLITADTEGEARAIGEAQNIYVSTVVPYANPDYAPPESPAPEPEPAYVAPPPPHPKRRTPPPPSSYVAQQQQLAYARPGASAAANTFADVPGAARRLRAADWVLSIVGLLDIVVGLVLGILGLIAQLRNNSYGIFDFTFVLVTLAMIAGGVLLLGAGAAMRMVASIGIATTEIARRK